MKIRWASFVFTALFAVFGGFGIFSLMYSPSEGAETWWTLDVPVAYETQSAQATGELLALWQKEGGIETDLERFRSIPWSATLVLLEESTSNIAFLTYVGQLGPDYPLQYAQESFRLPGSHYWSFNRHDWSLVGPFLILDSYKDGYNDPLLAVSAWAVSGALGLLLYYLSGKFWKK